jgi:dTDP-4-dehydrorhamnose 3,5-epimerase-like enzyme
VIYSSGVSGIVVVVIVHLQGTFRNRRGYFNETWCDDTFGQYDQIFAI